MQSRVLFLGKIGRKVCTLFVLLATFMVLTGAYAFAAGELPPGDAFKPDEGSFDAAKVRRKMVI